MSVRPAGGTQNLTAEDVVRLPVPKADFRVAYGKDPLQFGDLRLPEGEAPYPVAIVIHGGCWRARYNLDHISSFCAALTEAGVATWNLEYRRVGDPGGGWPGTFEDIAAGADHLREMAEAHRLDLNRVVAVGHSAGGQLVLWLAARHHLGEGAVAYSESPIRLRGVVSLAGVNDLRTARAEGVCGDMVSRLLGGSPDEVSARYRLASPIELLPLGTPLSLIHGARDEIVPPGMSREFVASAKKAGDDAELLLREEAGHFELIASGTAAWTAVRDVVLSLLGQPSR